MIQTTFVALFGAVAIWFGVRVFRTSSMVRSALSLLGALTAIGGMFLAMEAEAISIGRSWASDWMAMHTPPPPPKRVPRRRWFRGPISTACRGRFR